MPPISAYVGTSVLMTYYSPFARYGLEGRIRATTSRSKQALLQEMMIVRYMNVYKVRSSAGGVCTYGQDPTS